ncbi:hypothetical protein I204_01939 [Kwoniella mangroviensis CBS 8886]|nr:uncharacterized protein I203_03754 [Kwoniella mangroviensis CBS 8507]OCF67070.1 hypothetical protein I203_03754 [Kwoniella mangroviensis CBS 8507]OCF77935.1 hypothetical protein I204_01939 [Kwoniella mangroviensis CBS 8886]
MTQTIPFSLPFLRSHSIFIPPSSSSTSTSQDGDWELVDKPTDDLVGQKYGRMVMRDKDLLVAMGKEIRMMSLAAGGEGGWEVKEGKVGHYKTLNSQNLNFTIHHLIPNPNGRLLAVVGHHQVVVLVLPKSSYSSSSSAEVDCRTITVDEFQFSPSSNDAITKVAWHPWGEGGNSLWVLTADGKLREYDLNQPHDAVQTFNFLPSTSASSSSKFTAIDPSSRYATSFAFSIGSIDFSPLMIYVLLANGDIYSMGPILPLRTEMPIRYLQGLKAYSETKLAKIQDEARDVFGAGQAGLGRAIFQAQWVESLVKQVKIAEQQKKDESSYESPTTRRTTLLRQGPLVYSPAPQDIGNGDEDDEQAATDLYISQIQSSGEEIEEGEEVDTIIAIAWSGGRVDIGLEVERPEPRWLSSRDPSTSTPVLPIIESILLPFPQSDIDNLDSNAPTFLPDSLYRDVLYVQHSFGVDSININPWLEALRKDDASVGELPGSKVTRHVDSAGSPVKRIIGMINFCNITLGYGLLALAPSGQAAFVELDLRVTDSSSIIPPPTNHSENQKQSDEPDSQSLLLVKPLDFDKLINSIRTPNTPYNPSQLLRQRISGSSKPTTNITPDHLRALGEISSQVRQRTQAIRSGSQSIENRLDLQVKELQRQIKLLKDSQAKISNLKKNTSISRAEGLLAKQEQLGNKLDGLVGRLTEEFKPELGEQEKRWFEELDRLKVRVRGGSGVVSKGKSLNTKSQILKEQLSAIKPLLAELQLHQKEDESTQQLPNQNYGSKQLKPLEAALSARSEELRRLIRRMEMLDTRVESYNGAEDD